MGNYESIKYSKSQIRKAGEVISKGINNESLYEDYLPVVDNWRAVHAFPLDAITTIVSTAMEHESEVHVVQRLKRLESIIGKLQRPNNTGLLKMQDLGGCRVIVPSIETLYASIDKVRNALIDNGHNIIKETDYLNIPRENSGYRSYHMIVEYVGPEEYNGMRVEIQIRTKLEHSWATAVEIMDSTEKQTLKAGTGKAEYMRFFKLVSALFSLYEGTSVVNGISKNEAEIIHEIYELDKQHNIREKLSAYSSAIRMSGKYPNNADYYLIMVDRKTTTVSAKSFKKEQIDKATQEYQDLEKNKGNGKDYVLVAAKNFEIIRDCYPNYFGETQTFLIKIHELCQKYPEAKALNFLPKQNGKRILEYVTATRYEENIPHSVSMFYDDGIGASVGDVYCCPDYAISLDSSYLRYSGIVCKNESILKEKNIKPIAVSGPGIVILHTGASYYIDKDSWSYVSKADSILLQCKEGVDSKILYFIIAWLKSNVCTWDLLWNFNCNSAFYPKVISDMYIPNIESNIFEYVSNISKSLIEKEYMFVDLINTYEDSDPRVFEMIDDYNKGALTALNEIERCFIEYYQIKDNEFDIMKQGLALKGYFVY